VELLRYAEEQEPPVEDIEHFVAGAIVRMPVFPLQTSRYVLRDTYQTLSWLKSYIHCEVESLKADFVRKDKSFYIALVENPETGDRSVAFRLTTVGLAGYTEWLVTLRRVRFEDDPEYFLCDE
jgi:hypothetical protein